MAVQDNDYGTVQSRPGAILKVTNALKDEDLVSGRHNYLLDPVMYSNSKAGAGETSAENPAAELTINNARMNKQGSELEIRPEDSVVGTAINLARKMETTSTRKHVGRESTMGVESIARNHEGSPSQNIQRQARAGKKPRVDFNKMSHYEIMEHIEGAALRQRLNQSKQRDLKVVNVPNSEDNLVVDRNNLKSPTQSPPVGNYTSYDFMQQAEIAAEAFAKQQMSGLSLNAAEHIDSSAGGNTVNTQDRMERRLRGSQAALRDDIGSPISFQGVPR